MSVILFIINTIETVASEKRENIQEQAETDNPETTLMSFDEHLPKLKEVSQGWLNYLRMGRLHGKLKELDGWMRNRLMYWIGITRRSLNGKGKT